MEPLQRRNLTRHRHHCFGGLLAIMRSPSYLPCDSRDKQNTCPLRNLKPAGKTITPEMGHSLSASATAPTKINHTTFKTGDDQNRNCITTRHDLPQPSSQAHPHHLNNHRRVLTTSFSNRHAARVSGQKRMADDSDNGRQKIQKFNTAHKTNTNHCTSQSSHRSGHQSSQRQSLQHPVVHPVTQPLQHLQQSLQQSMSQSVLQSIQQSVQQSVQQSFQQSLQQSVHQSLRQSVQLQVQQPVQQPAQQPAHYPVQNPVPAVQPPQSSRLQIFLETQQPIQACPEEDLQQAQHPSQHVSDQAPSQGFQGASTKSTKHSSPKQSQVKTRPKHTCNECGKTFKRAHNLKIHGRLHNGDRPYACPFPTCNKEFRWKSSIVSHVNWHRTKKGDVLPPNALATHVFPQKVKKNCPSSPISQRIAPQKKIRKRKNQTQRPYQRVPITGAHINHVIKDLKGSNEHNEPNDNEPNDNEIKHIEHKEIEAKELNEPKKGIDTKDLNTIKYPDTNNLIESSEVMKEEQEGELTARTEKETSQVTVNHSLTGGENGDTRDTISMHNQNSGRLEELVQELVESGLELEAQGGFAVEGIDQGQEIRDVEEVLENMAPPSPLEYQITDLADILGDDDKGEFGDDSTIMTPSTTDRFDMFGGGLDDSDDGMCLFRDNNEWDGHGNGEQMLGFSIPPLSLSCCQGEDAPFRDGSLSTGISLTEILREGD